jgi:hypothetical protein
MTNLRFSLGRTIAGTCLVGVGLFAGCSGGGSSGGGIVKTSGQELCGAIASYVQRCGPATPCDEELVADCAKIVDLMNDSFLRAAADCMKAGGSPAGCLAGSFSRLAPSGAHETFAQTFCAECTGGFVPKCEELFFAEGDMVPDELKVAGAVILPLSDDLVEELRTECASASVLTCVARFSSCVQGVIAKRAVPADAVTCLFDGLINGDPTGGSTCPTAGEAGADGQAGAGGHGGADGQVGVGGQGGVGTTGGSGGAGGVGGSSGGCSSNLLGASCDSLGFGDSTCDGCMHTSCCTVTETCLDDQDCGGLVECLSTYCATATDVSACAQQYCGRCLGGATLLNEMVDCLSTSCNAACGTPCTADSDCKPNVCCNALCADLSTDRNNCGGCGVVCKAGETCEGGSCSAE